MQLPTIDLSAALLSTGKAKPPTTLQPAKSALAGPAETELASLEELLSIEAD